MSTPTREEINRALYGSDRRGSKYNVDVSAKGKEARTFVNPNTGEVIVFQSKHEMEAYRDYVLPQEHIGLFSNVRRQVNYDLHTFTPGGMRVKVGVYRADFVATTREGKPLVIDAKGAITELYKIKKAIFEAEYGLRIMEI